MNQSPGQRLGTIFYEGEAMRDHRQEIQTEAHKRMTKIEDNYFHHVPSDVRSYYLLLHLIRLGNFRDYYSEFGWLPLTVGDCNDGKEEAGFGSLTLFERDVICLLNENIESHERASITKRRPAGLQVIAPTIEL